MTRYHYTMIDLSIGQVGLVWLAEKPHWLMGITLPEDHADTFSLLGRRFPDPQRGSRKKIDKICLQLERYDQGEDIIFPLSELHLDRYNEFYRRVWTETYHIPRGKVGAYGQVARRISMPRAARAVGMALGKNPFPLIIPCHRVVKSNGDLGGFSGGGIIMKRRLLEKEGIVFDSRGRVKVG